MLKKICFFLSILFLLAMNLSCTSITSKELVVNRATSYKNSKSNEGLTIAVQPMNSADDCKEYFGIDLIATGILPVLIIADNDHQSFSYTIFKEKITIQVENKINAIEMSEPTLSKINSSDETKKKGDTTTTKNVIMTAAGVTVGLLAPPVVLAAGVVVGMPVFIAIAKSNADESIIKHNIVRKEFYTKTINPGERIYGFIYLKKPNNEQPHDSFNLMIDTANLEENKTNNFKFNISFRKD